MRRLGLSLGFETPTIGLSLTMKFSLPGLLFRCASAVVDSARLRNVFVGRTNNCIFGRFKLASVHTLERSDVVREALGKRSGLWLIVMVGLGRGLGHGLGRGRWWRVRCGRCLGLSTAQSGFVGSIERTPWRKQPGWRLTGRGWIRCQRCPELIHRRHPTADRYRCRCQFNRLLPLLLWRLP